MRFGHVGVTVGNLDRAIKFYEEAFGASLFARMTRSSSWIAEIVGCIEATLEFGHMRLPDGTHLELIQYHEPIALGTGPLLPWRTGHQHLCLVVDDVEKAVVDALMGGAAMRSKGIVTIPEGPNTGLRCCYLTGPSGETIELSQPAK